MQAGGDLYAAGRRGTRPWQVGIRDPRGGPRSIFALASIEDAAVKLKPEQVSEPLETDKDLYLIQLLALEDAPVKSFAEVKVKIMEKLQEPKAQNAIEQFLASLRMRANIRYLVPKDEILKG